MPSSVIGPGLGARSNVTQPGSRSTSADSGSAPRMTRIVRRPGDRDRDTMSDPVTIGEQMLPNHRKITPLRR
ncbi:hypothetical protein Ait01nite_072130 [Actinoplanes italicus]|nr:hypothetical protein Ait01nite_072130 [Actinoplanes italicus]